MTLMSRARSKRSSPGSGDCSCTEGAQCARETLDVLHSNPAHLGGVTRVARKELLLAARPTRRSRAESAPLQVLAKRVRGRWSLAKEKKKGTADKLLRPLMCGRRVRDVTDQSIPLQ